MRRPVLLAACCLLLAAPSAFAATVGGGTADSYAHKQDSVVPAKSWDKAEIKLVVAHGLMAHSVATFRANDVLNQGELATLVAALTQQPADTPTDPTAPVTVTQLDTRLVKALQLSDAASTVLSGARAAGLSVPSRFGTETIARLLGLRTNHPARDDDLELLPNDPVTRAETAYSVARILRFGGWEQQYAEDAADTFTLPTLGAWQKRVLNTAVKFIGFPYVWGGTSERAEAPFGVQARGGFDCSGFVWRVYKLTKYSGEGNLASVIRGRTTYVMSAEVPKSELIGFADLQPADLVFFGAHGARSKPSEVDHVGIYIGNGWFINSSDFGVALAQLTGWNRSHFAWGRRPLAEAGLTG